MKKTTVVLGILAGALTLACSTLSTDVDYDHTISFAKYHTFQLKEGTASYVTFTQQRIGDSIMTALTSKG